MKIITKTFSNLLTIALAAASFIVPISIGAQSANADTTVKSWSALAQSPNGSKLIAGTWGQGLYISLDTGTSWIQVTPDSSTASNASSSTAFDSRCYSPFIWTAVAISNDGQTLAGASWGCGLWVSTNGGLSWNQRSTTISGAQALNNRWKWFSIALSADGSIVYGVNSRTKIESGPTNSSVPLTQLTYNSSVSDISDCSRNLTQIYVIPDGNLFAKNDDKKCLFKVTVNSGDGSYGLTFYNPNGNTNYWSGAIDVINTGDSFTVYTAEGNQAHGGISVSRNSGSSWSRITSTSWSTNNSSIDRLWLRISASADGRRLIGIGSYDVAEIFLKPTTYSHLWISTNGGTTWSSPDYRTSSRHHWSEAKVLSDGSFIAIDGQETPFYESNFYNTDSQWNPAPTITGSSYSASPLPHYGNIWRSDNTGSNWVITDPTFFGGPAGRATLRASETSTVIYDPDQSLGQPKLIFSTAAPGATVTVTPTTNPASGTASPFMVGSRILDIAVVGVSGETQICVDGNSSEKMWHYRSGAWEDITTSHTSTQVCGTTTSFSPFAVGAAVPVAVANTDTGAAARAAKEALEARAREIEKAKSEIKGLLAAGKPLTQNQLLMADFIGVSSKNINLINLEIEKFSEDERKDLNKLEAVVLKYAIVDKVAEGRPFTSFDLIKIGLIRQDSKIKASIVSAIKKLPASAIDTYEKIQVAIAAVEKKAAERKSHLSSVLAKKR